MNFDNRNLNDLMTELYRFNPSLLIRSLDFGSIRRIASECVKEFKIHSVETVSDVSHLSNVKFVTNVKRKTCSKGKAN